MSDAPRATRFAVRPADWLHVDEAIDRILGSATPSATQSVSTLEALGRALAAPVTASATLPPWDNSAMDGYAVRGEDIRGASARTPVALRVTTVLRAGSDSGRTIEVGTAARIMTGAPIPEGADTVVRVEDTDAENEAGMVRIFDDRDSGRHVRPAGQDMRAGDTLFNVGHSVTHGTLGVLTAAGVTEVDVHAVPLVAVLPTGDELREPERYADVREGVGVPESNGRMLCAMATSIGARALHLGIAPDETDALEAKIAAGAEADALITIGGASMGEADLVKRALDLMGFTLDFWRVKMRPGSPVSFGWLQTDHRRQAVFGLPGNPSSAFVTFEVFVRPFLLRLAGHRRVLRRVITCRAGDRFDTPADLTYFQRVTLRREGSETIARLTGPQTSGLVRGLASADGLAIVPPEATEIAPGEAVEVMLLDTGPASEERSPR